MKTVLLAAAAAFGAMAFAAPASALPVAKIPGAESGPRAESVAWYCDKRGHCVKAPRAGYVVRYGWEPACNRGWDWNGYRCVAPRRVIVAPAPVVKIKPPKPAVVIKVK